MKLYHFSQTQKLPITQDVAWAFFSNPANLAQLMPPWLKMKDETFDPTKRIYPGMIFNYSVKLYGLIPTRWVGEIVQVREPDCLIDIQHFGPFRFWHHAHHITPVEGGVEVKDVVHYALPVGSFGEIAHKLFVRSQLQALFKHRYQMLAEFFG